jgi:hypothetical protein
MLEKIKTRLGELFKAIKEKIKEFIEKLQSVIFKKNSDNYLSRVRELAKEDKNILKLQVDVINVDYYLKTLNTTSSISNNIKALRSMIDEVEGDLISSDIDMDALNKELDNIPERLAKRARKEARAVYDEAFKIVKEEMNESINCNNEIFESIEKDISDNTLKNSKIYVEDIINYKYIDHMASAVDRLNNDVKTCERLVNDTINYCNRRIPQYDSELSTIINKVTNLEIRRYKLSLQVAQLAYSSILRNLKQVIINYKSTQNTTINDVNESVYDAIAWLGI